MPKISKRPDKRPARIRYWMKRQLEKNKVKNLVRYCKMTADKALGFWRKRRTTRMPDGFIKDYDRIL
jgi:hypothetical protein